MAEVPLDGSVSHSWPVLACVLLLSSPLLTHPPVPLQIVTLILENQSVLHGRELHLSVADIAHLSLLRVPKGRIVD